MQKHEKINYVEFPARDLGATKQFVEKALGWTFVDSGPDYASFADEGLDGGFFRSGLAARTSDGSALMVFYSENIEATLAKVVAAGGELIKPIFTFPGGRRFHFLEPSGNEFAVWSEPEA